uniref:Retroviral polymerase SH3-like domain-containing protein n=1 Tax=Fagus sylvatica TaxID=28930 RepID=A0A2N9J9L7_FAGSY
MCMCRSGERTKLDPKSRKCIFLGFEKGVKGYRLWDPISKKKVISRDVIFDETFMLKQNDAEVCEDSPKEKSTVEVEFDEDNLPSDKDNDEDDSQQQEEPYSITRVCDSPVEAMEEFGSCSCNSSQGGDDLANCLVVQGITN